MGPVKAYRKLQPQKRKGVTPAKLMLYSLCFIGLAIFTIIALTFSSSSYLGPDVGECRNIYMYPSYMRINGFDETHTRFAGKYSLFLYREQGKDPDFTKEQGIPVLFIPGNAGSYKQARSVASQTSNLFAEKFKDQIDGDKTNLDFFTADFNEDLTAFHGRTMLDQAEYLNDAIKFILSLYEAKPEATRPKSVLLIGHSMGGIVARAILTLPNYIDDSVNTIITLAAPHSAAPATFDGDVLRIYSEMDNFWRCAFIDHPQTKSTEKLHEIAKRRLANVSLISITGGVTDNTLPADYTQTNGIMPQNQSFTVFTTGIQDVYTTIDHLAIVWCDQLRKKLAEVLMAITTTSSSNCTYPIERRMAIFRKMLLSGFEELAKQDFEAFKIKNGMSKFDIRLKLDNYQINSNSLRIPVKNDQLSDKRRGKVNVFNIEENSQNSQFTLLSSLPITTLENLSNSVGKNPAVIGCKTAVSVQSDDQFFVDYTSPNTIKFAELDCVNLAMDAQTIPRSMANTKSVSESSSGGEYAPFNVIQYDADLITSFDAILVIESPTALDDEDFIIGELQPTSSTQLKLGEGSFWKLLTSGYDLSLPSRRPLAIDISIPSAWSSLISYKVSISGLSSLDLAKQKFAPFLRQSIDNPFETKWHVAVHNVKTLSITFHANPPFIQHDQDKIPNLHLQLWTDSLMMDESPLDIYLSVDIFNSLKLLVLRYRLAVISFPVSICLLVLAIQLKIFQKTGEFISFWDGLAELCKRNYLASIISFLTVLTPLLNIKQVDSLISLFNPVRFSDISSEGFARNTSFLGLRENYLLFLGPVFFVISLTLSALIYKLIMVIGHLFIYIYAFIVRFRKSTKNYSILQSSPLEENSFVQNTLQIFKTRRQMFGTILLLGAVSIYIPYQAAYVVCCLIQAVVVFRAFVSYSRLDQFEYETASSSNSLSDDDEDYALNEGKNIKAEAQLSRVPSSKRLQQAGRKNMLNYHVTILNSMVWIIPINVPVVVVFLHNFSLRWSTPFSSHHNLLAILPILLVVEKHVTGRMIVRNVQTRKLNPLLCIIAIYFAMFSLLFGMKNLFFLHHLLSLFFGVFLFSF